LIYAVSSRPDDGDFQSAIYIYDFGRRYMEEIAEGEKPDIIEIN